MRLHAAATAAVLLLMVGCGEDTLDANAKALANAKAALAAGNFTQAQAYFSDIYGAASPQYDAEQKIGLALVRTALWLEDVGFTLVELAEVFADASAAPGLRAVQDLAGDSFLNKFVYNTLAPSRDQLAEVIAQFDAALAEGLLPVTYPAIPLRIGDVPLAVLDGTVRDVELAFLASWLRLALFAYDLVLAADVEFGLVALGGYALDRRFCRDLTAAEQQSCWSELLAFAVHNSERALMANLDRGEVYRESARAALGGFFAGSADLFARLELAPPGQQQPGWLTWLPRPDGGGLVELRYRAVTLAIDDVRAVLDGTREIVPPYDSSEQRVRYVVPRDVVEGAAAAAAHLTTGTPARIPVATTLQPLATSLLESLLQAKPILILLQVIFEAIDPELTEFSVETYTRIAAEYSDVRTADALDNLLRFLLPPSLAVDLRPLFRHDDYLRIFLPDAVTTGAWSDDLPTWAWLVEYECDLGQVDLFGCSASAALTDAPHFVGTPVSLAADGIPSPIAVVGYSDPSWRGMLWLDPWQVDPRFPRGVTHPDLEQLNALFREVGLEWRQRLDAIELLQP